MRASLKHLRIKRAVNVLKEGGIVAYPTEAVYGLGCDPFNPAAVHHLLKIKQRPVYKGLILIAADWNDVASLVETVEPQKLAAAKQTWPGPYTWVFPASEIVPPWIRGQHDTVAIRITAHPIANSLCKAFGGPLVSTSANIAAEPPLKLLEEVRQQFIEQVDFILPGRVGGLLQPTEIRDVQTGKIIREA